MRVRGAAMISWHGMVVGSVLLLLPCVATADRSLVLVDTPQASRARVVFSVEHDAAVQKGPDGAPNQIAATLAVFYSDAPSNIGSYALPGTRWQTNARGTARYVNRV